jgi:hypothetical protein
MWENKGAESIGPPAAHPEQELCMIGIEWLKENLQRVFMLPAPVVEWLIMVYDAIQVFDDVADGDTVERKDLNATIWNTLVGMHQNQFFITNSHHLVPLLATAIMKWQASDHAERAGDADARSFVWRAGYYDLILMAISLTHGPGFATKNAHLVMDLYGEKFEDYMKEFGNA